MTNSIKEALQEALKRFPEKPEQVTCTDPKQKRNGQHSQIYLVWRQLRDHGPMTMQAIISQMNGVVSRGNVYSIMTNLRDRKMVVVADQIRNPAPRTAPNHREMLDRFKVTSQVYDLDMHPRSEHYMEIARKANRNHAEKKSGKVTSMPIEDFKSLAPKVETPKVETPDVKPASQVVGLGTLAGIPSAMLDPTPPPLKKMTLQVPRESVQPIDLMAAANLLADNPQDIPLGAAVRLYSALKRAFGEEA